MVDLIPFGRRMDRLAKSAFGDMSDVFDNFFNTFTASFNGGMMRSDIKDKGNEYEVDIELPGVKKEDIDINLENGYLTVAVNTTEETNDEKDNYIVKERRYGGYQRSFRLNSNVKKSDIKAAYKNGILALTIPKTEEKKEKDTKIIIS